MTAYGTVQVYWDRSYHPNLDAEYIDPRDDIRVVIMVPYRPV
jgi:hypothetical protein